MAIFLPKQAPREALSKHRTVQRKCLSAGRQLPTVRWRSPCPLGTRSVKAQCASLDPRWDRCLSSNGETGHGCHPGHSGEHHGPIQHTDVETNPMTRVTTARATVAVVTKAFVAMLRRSIGRMAAPINAPTPIHPKSQPNPIESIPSW